MIISVITAFFKRNKLSRSKFLAALTSLWFVYALGLLALRSIPTLFAVDQAHQVATLIILVTGMIISLIAIVSFVGRANDADLHLAWLLLLLVPGVNVIVIVLLIFLKNLNKYASQRRFFQLLIATSIFAAIGGSSVVVYRQTLYVQQSRIECAAHFPDYSTELTPQQAAIMNVGYSRCLASKGIQPEPLAPSVQTLR